MGTLYFATIALAFSILSGFYILLVSLEHNLLGFKPDDSLTASRALAHTTFSSEFSDEESGAYRLMYPELYFRSALKGPLDNAVYLTLEDIPSDGAFSCLEILKAHQVGAVFFLGKADDGSTRKLLKRIADEGYAAGICLSPCEPELGVESYLADFSSVQRLIIDATGSAPHMYRFSDSGAEHDGDPVRRDLMRELSRRGYLYYGGEAPIFPTSGLSEESVSALLQNIKYK